MTETRPYDLLIIGGGISGAALLYCAARFSSLKRIALVEKYSSIAAVNSSARNNSQTLHCGDIETNYTLDKALKVKHAAGMVTRYAEDAPDRHQFFFQYPKMVLAVGDVEVNKLHARYEQFAAHYPGMRWLNKHDIAAVEPRVVDHNGSPRQEELGACATLNEYCAVDYRALAQSFVDNAQRQKKQVAVHLDCKVAGIEHKDGMFSVPTSQGILSARAVVVSAGGHSLLFAQRMGYGLNFSVLPVAGSFYYTPKVLNGKVYTMQNDKLPFAAVHGDPDVLEVGKTRFGPTAIILPMLERYAPSTIGDFLRVVRIDGHVVKVLAGLFGDAEIRRYMLKNMLFEIPILRRHLFLKDAQKIVPSLRLSDLRFARHTGGIRPQLIDKIKDQLLLGEAKIDSGKGIIFNMTPSPGATSCLANAEKDLAVMASFLGEQFYQDQFAAELVEPASIQT